MITVAGRPGTADLYQASLIFHRRLVAGVIVNRLVGMGLKGNTLPSVYMHYIVIYNLQQMVQMVFCGLSRTIPMFQACFCHPTVGNVNVYILIYILMKAVTSRNESNDMLNKTTSQPSVFVELGAASTTSFIYTYIYIYIYIYIYNYIYICMFSPHLFVFPSKDIIIYQILFYIMQPSRILQQ